MKAEKKLIASLYSRFNSGLVSIVLILLIVLLLHHVPYIFLPIEQFMNLVVFPVVLTMILYYLASPIVDFLEKWKIPRVAGIFLLVIVIIGGLTLISLSLFPTIEHQIESFGRNLPHEIDALNAEANKFLDQPIMEPVRNQAYDQITKVNEYIQKYGSQASTTALHSISSIWAFVEKTLLGLIMTPFMLFFLLKDDRNILPTVLRKLPNAWRNEVKSVFLEIHKKLSSYIIGQLIIAVFITVVLAIGFAICGLDYGITLAILAGILNFLIPTFGAWFGIVPAGIVAILNSPLLLLWVFILFFVVQHLQSHFLAPVVLGNQLDIHPLTILILLLWAGHVFGFVGLILVVPIYASVKVIVEHAFKWYRANSGLYQD